MTKVDKYILAEVAGPFLLGFLVYTFLLLIQVIFKSADLFIRSDTSGQQILELFALSLPAIVVLTLPMAFLFGTLMGMGRFSADSEVTAFQANGFSVFKLYRPVALFSVLIFGLNLYLMIDVLPRGNKAFTDLRNEMLETVALTELRPNFPNIILDGSLLYIFGENLPGKGWSEIFLADSITRENNIALTAESGFATFSTAPGDNSYLVFKKAVSHKLNFLKPDQYVLSLQEDFSTRLTTNSQGLSGTARRSLRELSLAELSQRKILSTPEQQNLISIEVNKRFSFPFACIVFGLIGLPIGITGARSGKSAGFALSIGIIVVYYILFNTGEELARDGTLLPSFAVWLPNILFLIVGVTLLSRRNQQKEGRLPSMLQKLTTAVCYFIKTSSKYSKQASPKKPTFVKLSMPKIYLAPLGRIDSYIFTTFFRMAAISSLSMVSIFIIADATDTIEDFLKNAVDAGTIVTHYRAKFLIVLYQVSPIVFLVSTLFTFIILSKSNELVALRAIGVSFLRISAPVIICAALLTSALYFLQANFLPDLYRSSNKTKSIIKHGHTGTIGENLSRSSRERKWIVERNGRAIFNFETFNESKNELSNLQIFYLDETHKIISRLFCRNAKFIDGDYWMTSKGWIRDFRANEVVRFEEINSLRKLKFAKPDFFRKSAVPSEEMKNAELMEILNELSATGRSAPELSVAYGERMSYPITAFAMCLVALPFSFRYEKRGAIWGVSFALLIGFSLVVTLALFRAAGVGGFLPPQLSVWIPPVLFGFASIYLFLGVQS